MMGKYLSETEYWQVKSTGEIMEVPAAPRSPEWIKEYRRVVLFHHAESGCVLVVDYFDERSREQCWQNMCDEVDIKTYKYWKMIYDNPDI